MTTNDTTAFERGCLVQLSVRAWTGRVKIPAALVVDRPGVDPAFVGAHKRLVDKSALAAITKASGAARIWVYARSLPFPVRGALFVPVAMVSQIDAKLAEFKAEFDAAADRFASDFATLREAARTALGPLYDESDYPPNVRACYAFEWRFVTLAPPGATQLLDPALVEREREKFVALMTEARESAVTALRVRFAEIVDHAVEKLSSDRADGKPQIFRDSLVENAREFFDVFGSLNIADDSALDALVARAKAVLDGVDAKDLRDDSALRAHIAQSMADVQATLDSMIVDRPTRKLRFGTAASAPESVEV